MTALALYVGTAALLGFSFMRNRRKTILALKKAWKSFENILPQFLAILLLIGFILAVLDEATISKLLGKESGVIGLGIAAIILLQYADSAGQDNADRGRLVACPEHKLVLAVHALYGRQAV